MLINKSNSRGNRQPLCGTPESIWEISDLYPLIFTHWNVPDNYDLNHDNNGSPNPDFLRVRSSKLWLTLLKAFSKSEKITSTWQLLSKASRMKLLRTNKFIMAERPGLKPYCLSMRTELTEGRMLLSTSFSKSLAIWLRIEISL